jgi:hypothetical protein
MTTTLEGLTYQQPLAMESHFAAAAVGTTTTAIPVAPSPSNSGAWTIFPGLLTIDWDYDASKGTADIKAVFLFWTIDTLTGTLRAGDADLKDDLDLGVIKGSLEVDAKFASPGGITLSGSLSLFGAAPGAVNVQLAKW